MSILIEEQVKKNYNEKNYKEKILTTLEKHILLIRVVNYDNELLSFEIPLTGFDFNTSLKNMNEIEECISIVLTELNNELQKLENNKITKNQLKEILSNIIATNTDFQNKIDFVKHLNTNAVYENIEQSLKEVVNHRNDYKGYDNVNDFMNSLTD